MQVLAAFRLGNVTQTDLLQNLLGHVQRNVRPRVSHLGRAVGGLLVPGLFQTDLLQDADQQLVHVVLDATGRFNELDIPRLRQSFSLCKGEEEQGMALQAD